MTTAGQQRILRAVQSGPVALAWQDLHIELSKMPGKTGRVIGQESKTSFARRHDKPGISRQHLAIIGIAQMGAQCMLGPLATQIKQWVKSFGRRRD